MWGGGRAAATLEPPTSGLPETRCPGTQGVLHDLDHDGVPDIVFEKGDTVIVLAKGPDADWW